MKDCFYDDPLTGAAERYYKSTEWQALKKLLPNPPGKALDVGSGRGISSYALAKDGWQVIALEPDKSFIVGAGAIRALATESGLPISVVEERGEVLPFPAQTFDLVHCRQVLHHAQDLNKLCLEIGRVMKKNAILIATREHVITKKADLSAFLRSHPLHYLYGGEHAYTLKEYRAAIVSGGIEIMKIFGPYDSDINLFPSSITEIRSQLSRKIGFNIPASFFKWTMAMRNVFNNVPGRLYSFVGIKR